MESQETRWYEISAALSLGSTPRPSVQKGCSCWTEWMFLLPLSLPLSLSVAQTQFPVTFGKSRRQAATRARWLLQTHTRTYTHAVKQEGKQQQRESRCRSQERGRKSLRTPFSPSDVNEEVGDDGAACISCVPVSPKRVGEEVCRLKNEVSDSDGREGKERTDFPPLFPVLSLFSLLLSLSCCPFLLSMLLSASGSRVTLLPLTHTQQELEAVCVTTASQVSLLSFAFFLFLIHSPASLLLLTLSLSP